MKRGTQIIILLVLLLLPGMSYLFLKVFAKNEYAVLPLYQTGRIEWPAGCDQDAEVPYHVPAAAMDNFPAVREDSLSVFHFVYRNDSLARMAETQLRRIEKVFQNGELGVIRLDRDSVQAQELRCAFLMKGLDSTVMVDRHLRIRGYYDATSTKDCDRMLAEITIILRKY